MQIRLRSFFLLIAGVALLTSLFLVPTISRIQSRKRLSKYFHVLESDGSLLASQIAALDKEAMDSLRDLGAEVIELNLSSQDLRRISPEFLESLTGIEILVLDNVCFDGSFLEHLQPSLRELYVRNTGLDDNAVSHLNRLIGIEKLYLRNNRLTSDGIKSLSSLKKLRYLEVDKTGLDDDQITELKAEFDKKCVVHCK